MDNAAASEPNLQVLVLRRALLQAGGAPLQPEHAGRVPQPLRPHLTPGIATDSSNLLLRFVWCQWAGSGSCPSTCRVASRMSHGSLQASSQGASSAGSRAVSDRDAHRGITVWPPDGDMLPGTAR